MKKWLIKKIADFVLEVQNQLNETRRARARAHLKEKYPDDDFIKGFDTFQ